VAQVPDISAQERRVASAGTVHQREFARHRGSVVVRTIPSSPPGMRWSRRTLSTWTVLDACLGGGSGVWWCCIAGPVTHYLPLLLGIPDE
jgi:hypothetical protein